MMISDSSHTTSAPTSGPQDGLQVEAVNPIVLNYIVPSAGIGVIPDGYNQFCLRKAFDVQANFTASSDFLIVTRPHTCNTRIGDIWIYAGGDWRYQGPVTMPFDISVFQEARVASSMLTVFSDTISTTNATLAGRGTTIMLPQPPRVAPDYSLLSAMTPVDTYKRVNFSLAEGTTTISVPQYVPYALPLPADSPLRPVPSSPDFRQLYHLSTTDPVPRVSFDHPFVSGSKKVSLKGYINGEPNVAPKEVTISIEATVHGGAVYKWEGDFSLTPNKNEVIDVEFEMALKPGTFCDLVLGISAGDDTASADVMLEVTHVDPIYANDGTDFLLTYVQGLSDSRNIVIGGRYNYELVPTTQTAPQVSMYLEPATTWLPLEWFRLLLNNTAQTGVRIVYDRAAYLTMVARAHDLASPPLITALAKSVAHPGFIGFASIGDLWRKGVKMLKQLGISPAKALMSVYDLTAQYPPLTAASMLARPLVASGVDWLESQGLASTEGYKRPVEMKLPTHTYHIGHASTLGNVLAGIDFSASDDQDESEDVEDSIPPPPPMDLPTADRPIDLTGWTLTSAGVRQVEEIQSVTKAACPRVALFCAVQTEENPTVDQTSVYAMFLTSRPVPGVNYTSPWPGMYVDKILNPEEMGVWSSLAIRWNVRPIGAAVPNNVLTSERYISVLYLNGPKFDQIAGTSWYGCARSLFERESSVSMVHFCGASYLNIPLDKDPTLRMSAVSPKTPSNIGAKIRALYALGDTREWVQVFPGFIANLWQFVIFVDNTVVQEIIANMLKNKIPVDRAMAIIASAWTGLPAKKVPWVFAEEALNVSQAVTVVFSLNEVVPKGLMRSTTYETQAQKVYDLLGQSAMINDVTYSQIVEQSRNSSPKVNMTQMISKMVPVGTDLSKLTFEQLMAIPKFKAWILQQRANNKVKQSKAKVPNRLTGRTVYGALFGPSAQPPTAAGQRRSPTELAAAAGQGLDDEGVLHV